MENTKGECGCKVVRALGSAKNEIDYCPLHKSALDLYEGLNDALTEICRMCVRLNPQHKDCKSCEEIERSRQPLRKAEGK